MIGRELERRRYSRERVGPVRQLLLENLPLEPRALPVGEVGELHARLRQRRQLATDERAV